MSLLALQQPPVVLPVESLPAESDADSGMGSPMEVETTEKPPPPEKQADSDDDEDIAVARKPRSRKALRDSDSEDAEEAGGMEGALVLSASSEGEAEEAAEEKAKVKKATKTKKRIARLSRDSEDSEKENSKEKDGERDGGRRREKSKRRKERERKKEAGKKQQKETSEEILAPEGINDSGCLLGNTDLFDAEQGEDEEEEEESVEAIRAAVKQKAKKHKPHLEEEQEHAEKPQRVERKAARASKEYIKQLHSETQRLVRESSIGLPYHLPEPKSIHEFFKKRARPQGPAMSLLKSAQYQAVILEATAASTKQSQSTEPQQAEEAPAAASDLQAPTDAPSVQQQEEPTAQPDSGEATPAALSDILMEDAPSLPDEPVVPAVPEVPGSEPKDEDASAALAPPAEAPAPAPAPAIKTRKDKLTRLRELGLDPPPVAKLRSSDDAFVELEAPQVNPGLEALKDRFLRHVQPVVRPKGERSVQLSVIRKESAASGQEELRTDAFTVTLTEEEKLPANKPGECLLLLKSRLQKAMAVRRQEERQKRAALYRLDNEDCGEEEEEEEDMTESEDEEGVDELLGGGDEQQDEDEADEDEEEEEVAADSNMAVMRSPSPPHDNDVTLMLFAGSSCSRTSDGVKRMGAGQDSDNKLEEDDSLSLVKDSSHNSSFELIGSMIPSYQPVNRTAGRGVASSVFRSPSPCLFRPSFLGSASKSSGKGSDPSMLLPLPVEDSQDLYAPPSPSEAPLGGFSLDEDTPTHTQQEEPQSQLLTADGFLNVGRPGAPPTASSSSSRQRLILESLDENAMDANMDELLGLCSGGFATQNAGGSSMANTPTGTLERTASPLPMPIPPPPSLPDMQASSDTDMDQLLELCSGKFTSPSATPLTCASSPASHTKTTKASREETGCEDEEPEEDDCEFKLLSDVESLSGQDESGEDDDDGGKDEGDEEDEDEAEEEKQAVFGRPKGKRKLRLTEFVDSEAELSGSDLGSDDEEGGGDSEYEEDELQEDLPSDEELQDQVNKIHMKQVLDDDKRQLRLYQERYLADGDLHSDGPGRMRRFRWKNMENGFDFAGPGGEGEEEEEDEELDQTEMQRRKERLEREQWLREQSEAQSKKSKGEAAVVVEEEEDDECFGEEENSQFMKLAKKVMAKTLQKKEAPVAPVQEKKAATDPFRRPAPAAVVKRGSLLSQPKTMLQKLASISDGNPIGPRSTRGFLFQTLSPEKNSASSDRPKQVKKRLSSDSPAPIAKRPRQEKKAAAPGPPRSIFSYLEN